MNTIVIGLQYGDEGKGRVVDYLAKDYDWVARFNGGPNAGHTIYIKDKKYKLHHIPSGILQRKKCFIGNGCIIDIDILFKEIDELESQGFDVKNNLFISELAHIITRDHINRDINRENNGKGNGSTKRGIAPCYSDKYYRSGIQVKNCSEDRIFRYLVDPLFLTDKNNILFEGAQGALLDIDFGNYPYVSSSSAIVAQAMLGTGYSFKKIDKVIGVSKPYITRVGKGQLSTQMNKEDEILFRDLGQEYGTTTGRARNLGWLNLIELRYACKLNDIDTIFLTKMDILVGKRIKIFNRHKCQDIAIPRFDLYDNSRNDYVIDEFSIKDVEDIEFIEYLENELNVKIEFISYGTERDDVIKRINKI